MNAFSPKKSANPVYFAAAGFTNLSRERTAPVANVHVMFLADCCYRSMDNAHREVSR